MYRTFARPNVYPTQYASDVVYPHPQGDGVTDAEFKAQADLQDGCSGRASINTHFDNTEVNIENLIAPKSEISGGFDMSEEPVEGNAGDAKHWIRD